jgi:hypothetical protein
VVHTVSAFLPGFVYFMNMQEYIENAVKAARQATLAESDQLTLGELILKLEAIAEKNRGKEDKDLPLIGFDFEYLFPTKLDSWRGSYAELALNFKTDGDRLNINKFLGICKDAIGATFYGYKGGEFIMNKHTPIWVANYGNSGSTALIDVVDNQYEVILITGLRKY